MMKWSEIRKERLSNGKCWYCRKDWQPRCPKCSHNHCKDCICPNGVKK